MQSITQMSSSRRATKLQASAASSVLDTRWCVRMDWETCRKVKGTPFSQCCVNRSYASYQIRKHGLYCVVDLDWSQSDVPHTFVRHCLSMVAQSQEKSLTVSAANAIADISSRLYQVCYTEVSHLRPWPPMPDEVLVELSAAFCMYKWGRAGAVVGAH